MMNAHAEVLRHCRSQTLDGARADVVDFLIDASAWEVRGVTVRLGRWPWTRCVVVPVDHIVRLEPAHQLLLLGITASDLAECAQAGGYLSHPPPSLEDALNDADAQEYGWAGYREGLETFLLSPGAPVPERGWPTFSLSHADSCGDVQPLLPLRALLGTVVRAEDQALGVLVDLLIDIQTWRVRGLVLQSSPSAGGPMTVVSVSNVETVDACCIRLGSPRAPGCLLGRDDPVPQDAQPLDL